MVVKIQRWSPDTCNCVIEQMVEYDDENVPSEPQFLMMNEVCDEHKHLASTERGPRHIELSPNVLKLIEETKARNLKQVDDLLAKPGLRGKTKKELLAARQHVLEHNKGLDEEWGELVNLPHAFDSHIHDHILTSRKQRNG